MSRPCLHTDLLMITIEQALIGDMSYRHGNFWSDLSNRAYDGYKAIRQYEPHIWDGIDAQLVKADLQVTHFLKRYIATTDAFSQADLEKKGEDKFSSFQARHVSRSETFRSQLVVRTARRLAREILGPFSQEELNASCRFGQRAAHGLPLAKSALFQRVGSLTGSVAQVRWFSSHVQHDRMLLEAIRWGQQRNMPLLDCTSTDFLNVTCVPKSWKAVRTIAPDTVIGGYRHNGLGLMLERRLKKAGLNIHVLQDRHRDYIKTMSLNDSGVTADLSAASDSFTSALVNQLLPRDWYRAVNFGRIKQAVVGGRMIHLTTFMTMGCGFTFTLQTLLFYCLLRALQELSGFQGRVSVYGDDLIYPRRLHPFVVGLFQDIGFQLNKDKTFASGPFRESCGEDSYRGCSVRPFMPEIESPGLYWGVRLRALLYRLHNGLTEKWAREEIPRALGVIEQFLLDYFPGQVHPLVPPSHPEDSGLRVQAGVLPTMTPGLNLGAPVWVSGSYPSSASPFEATATKGRSFPHDGWYIPGAIHAEMQYMEAANPFIYMWDRLRAATQRPTGNSERENTLASRVGCWFVQNSDGSWRFADDFRLQPWKQGKVHDLRWKPTKASREARGRYIAALRRLGKKPKNVPELCYALDVPDPSKTTHYTVTHSLILNWE